MSIQLNLRFFTVHDFKKNFHRYLKFIPRPQPAYMVAITDYVDQQDRHYGISIFEYLPDQAFAVH